MLRDRLADVGGEQGLPGLLEFLVAVPDPRRVRGRRHLLAAILALACTATVAGCRSLTAIAEHDDARRSSPVLLTGRPRLVEYDSTWLIGVCHGPLRCVAACCGGVVMLAAGGTSQAIVR